MTGDPDAVVIGSGPNGLAAACRLARAGLRVLVLEAHPTHAGGALGSDEGTLPGFVHDVGAAYFPFGRSSPAFRELDLVGRGVTWLNAPIESCHPAPDGSVASIARDPEVVRGRFGSAEDGETWVRLARWHAGVESRLFGALLGPLPALGPVLRLLPFDLARLARVFLSTPRAVASRLFRSAAARRVLPALGMHVDVGPEDRFGAGMGWVLGMAATTDGFQIPRGGARAISQALLAILAAHGGEVRLGARVSRVVVRGGRAAAVRLVDGEEIRVGRAVLADTAAPSLLLDLVERAHIPSRVVAKMERFPYGWGTFKMDFALSGPVPWTAQDARASACVHTGDSVDDLSRFVRDVRDGRIPERPYLVIGQPTLVDPSRAPPGRHTLWLYSRVPPRPEGGWTAGRERFADAIEERIERLAPGFRASVLARRIVAPPDLEAANANLVDGNLGGGSNAWNRQLVFRPVFPYFRYRTPVRGLYLCSSYAHPGAGVHGMCGWNASRAVLRDVRAVAAESSA